MKVRGNLCALAPCFAFALVLAGCLQGQNDVCQVHDDCESPLVCNAGTGRCQRPGAADVADAAPPADAALMPDASPDAAPAIDAAVDPAAH